jgi:N-acetyl-1-D-myo-inositol-2-amino-2-deoxy-alpha-D-glucopyranoside deacetylase/mycothiol S-conjugate amidase
MKTILVVLAHPDDESFGMGGTIAWYASQGVDVHLACATRGEAGTVDAEYLTNYKSIAELREAELACAAKALGLKSVNYLDYRDSGMAGSEDNRNPASLVQAPLEQVAGRVVKLIRNLKPQVVVTFDPVGGYHHPDHIHIHKATVMAFHAAGDAKQYPEAGAAFQPGKLYFTALNRRRLHWLVRTMRLTGKDPTKVGRNKDIDLTMLTRDADTPRHVNINYRSVEDRKNAADACHASQQGGRFSLFNMWDLYYKLVGRSDNFTRMHPPTADSWRAKDLFAD